MFSLLYATATDDVTGSNGEFYRFDAGFSNVDYITLPNEPGVSPATIHLTQRGYDQTVAVKPDNINAIFVAVCI
jgi:hypothetical protein